MFISSSLIRYKLRDASSINYISMTIAGQDDFAYKEVTYVTCTSRFPRQKHSHKNDREAAHV